MLNKRIPTEDFLSFAGSLAGETLATERGAQFHVEVANKGLKFTPLFSSQGRSFGRKQLDASLDRLAQRGSFQTADYPETKSAGNYWLVVAKLYFERNSQPR
jgi:hypothetical protein